MFIAQFSKEITFHFKCVFFMYNNLDLFFFVVVVFIFPLFWLCHRCFFKTDLQPQTLNSRSKFTFLPFKLPSFFLLSQFFTAIYNVIYHLDVRTIARTHFQTETNQQKCFVPHRVRLGKKLVNKAGYTANVSRERVGRGKNTPISHFSTQVLLFKRRTEGQTDKLT